MTEAGSSGRDGENFTNVETEKTQPFKISIATFNVGNGKRGLDMLRGAMDRMVTRSIGGGGIVGFQEIPPEYALALQQTLPPHWKLHNYPNPTDEDLSMAIAYDASQLVLQDTVQNFILPSLPAWLQFFQIPRRETPLERSAQIVHFTNQEDQNTHIVLVNGHLSVLGFLKQRRAEVDNILARLCIFLHEQGLVNAQTDEAFPDQKVSVYFVGDFNTPGRVGSKRNARQIQGLRLFEQGFTKLNDALEPTSNVLSSFLHKMHDVQGNLAFERARQFREHARRGANIQKVLVHAIEFGLQHRDHVFNKLYGLQHVQEVEQTVFTPPDHPIASDHYMVLTGSVLEKIRSSK